MPPDKELLISTRQFAREIRWRSWWHVGTTLAVVCCLAAITSSELNWPARVLASGLLGLAIVRVFVLYHDFQHGAILRHSRPAQALMRLVGMILLTPASGWNRSHNFHHTHNSKLSAPDIGTYPLMTVDQYRNAGWAQRALYVAQRHSLTMCCGYLAVFLFGMCLRPFFANPRRHWDGGVSVIGHSALLLWLGCDEPDDLVLSALVPFSLASAIGAYLFYVQHNFPGVHLTPASDWRYTAAALASSSYLRMGPLMNWFTANIGYHHVHHLNARIPFYRLPDAMRAIPALQAPECSSLAVADIRACLRLKLWDPDSQRLVPWSSLQDAA
jgi:omega-6 fatty acid desaturase (delta-12 desaturase)